MSSGFGCEDGKGGYGRLQYNVCRPLTETVINAVKLDDKL